MARGEISNSDVPRLGGRVGEVSDHGGDLISGSLGNGLYASRGIPWSQDSAPGRRRDVDGTSTGQGASVSILFKRSKRPSRGKSLSA